MIREFLASWVAALLPRRVVAHAFARVLADVQYRGAFHDVEGLKIVRVSVEADDYWGRRVVTYRHGGFSCSTLTGRETETA